MEKNVNEMSDAEFERPCKVEVTDEIEQCRKEVAKSKRRIMAALGELPSKTRKYAEGLASQTAWLEVKCAEFQEYFIVHPTTCEYQNGPNQSGEMQHPKFKNLMSMTKQYQSNISTLAQFLPKEERKAFEDGFEEFVMSK